MRFHFGTAAPRTIKCLAAQPNLGAVLQEPRVLVQRGKHDVVLLVEIVLVELAVELEIGAELGIAWCVEREALTRQQHIRLE